MNVEVKVQHAATCYNEATDEVEIWLFINGSLTKFKKHLRDIK